MITFYAQGGLGNQMFQYALARNLSILHSCGVAMDPYWFEHTRRDETHRKPDILHFQVALELVSRGKQQRYRLERSRLGRILGTLSGTTVLREKSEAFDSKILNAPTGAYLSGYWQSELYFSTIKALLKHEFTPHVAPSDSDLSIMDLISKSNAPTSIHIRRGDYVTSKSAAGFHGVCPIEYYQQGLEKIYERVAGADVFVFSDDPNWAEANLKNRVPTHIVRHNDSSSAFQDLRLMSRCSHHVIANSSFSWWGAWLAEKEGSIVVAPSRWFTAKTLPTDLLPTRWLRV